MATMALMPLEPKCCLSQKHCQQWRKSIFLGDTASRASKSAGRSFWVGCSIDEAMLPKPQSQNATLITQTLPMLQVDYFWDAASKPQMVQVDCFSLGRSVKEGKIANAAGNSEPNHQCHRLIGFCGMRRQRPVAPQVKCFLEDMASKQATLTMPLETWH